MSQEPTAAAGGRDLLHFDFRGSRRPPPHTHTPRTLARTPPQGPTQDVTPSPKSRIERGKLLGFSTLQKPAPWGERTRRSHMPPKVLARGPPRGPVRWGDAGDALWGDRGEVFGSSMLVVYWGEDAAVWPARNGFEAEHWPPVRSGNFDVFDGLFTDSNLF